MHVEFFVEEPSAEAALSILIPKIFKGIHTFRFHPFQGKADLLKNLPARLKGYSSWLPRDWKIVVLIDQDNQDCFVLKGKLEESAKKAGLRTKTLAKGKGTFQVLNRLAIEELEAWFFGDVSALKAAYPRIPVTLGKKPKYSNPDSIVGGTWEALERELKKAGYYPTGMPKIEVARNVSPHMDAERNRSHSFQVFVNGLKACLV
jgi:hypothetical protein